jgi:ribokinase
VERRPEPGETVLARGHHRVSGGGKGANQAHASSRAGARTALLGCVGRDAPPEALEGLDGVDLTGVRTLDDVPTGAAFITLTPDGENSIVVSPGANARVDAAFVEAAAEAIERADVFCTVLELPLDAVRRGCEIAREAGARVVLTPAPVTPGAGALLPLVDVLILNRGEAQALGDTGGARALVLTLGADGALVADANGEERIPAEPAGPIVDTTGAGDALAGVLAARLAFGDDLRAAARAGVRAAGITVTRRGARALI